MDRNTKIVCRGYLQFVREHPCAVCGGTAADAHHVKARGGGSGKQNDFTAIPLCREHHADLHQVGVSKFEERWNINLWGEAIWILIEFIALNSSTGKQRTVPITIGKQQGVI